MNYLKKYLKYKIKYLKNINPDVNINNYFYNLNNRTNFKVKYIKYKTKYLLLGGTRKRVKSPVDYEKIKKKRDEELEIRREKETQYKLAIHRELLYKIDENTKFYPIEMNFEDTKINITPIKFFKLTLQPHKDKEYYVVMYRIQLQQQDKNIVIVIPYYISDGHDNHFRANIMLPFYGVTNILLKINFVKNNNLDEFNNEILHSFKADEQACIIKESIDKYGTVGVLGIYSFLNRLQNLLDLVIAINVESIFKEYDSIYTKHYRPNYDISNINNKYNMNIIGTKESAPYKHFDAPYNDQYRWMIYYELHKIYNILSKNKLFERKEAINLRLESINSTQFNNYYEICKNRDRNMDKNDLFNNYVYISDVIREKYRSLLKKNHEDLYHIINEKTTPYIDGYNTGYVDATSRWEASGHTCDKFQ